MTKKIDFINPSTPPSSGRLLGLQKQPDPYPNPDLDPFELDEGDVVWSSDERSESSETHSLSPPAPSSSSVSPSHLRRGFGAGLSAALAADSPSLLIRRKSSLNPTISAARLIPPLPIHGVGASRFPASAPVNVPVWGKRVADQAAFDDVDDDVEEEEEMVPPHVIVARSHVTAFSVFEGVGRTLKGRDLRSVRNAVFQKTGFID